MIAKSPRTSHQPTPRVPGLEREKVVQAALALLDEAGFDKLTLRRVADKLGVKAAALYWHFKNKQDLIDEMALYVIRGGPPRPEQRIRHMPWQDLLRQVGRTQRRALLAHRDGARLIASADLTSTPLLEGMERLLHTLHTQGFPADLALLSLINISRYTLGCVFEDQADPRAKEAAQTARQQLIQQTPDRFPVVAQAIGELAGKRGLTPTRQYEHGLDLLITGLERKLQQTKA